MEIVKQTLRKTIMPILLCMAFFSTFFTISNVSAGDLTSKVGKYKIFSLSEWIQSGGSNQLDGSISLQENSDEVYNAVNVGIDRNQSDYELKNMGVREKNLPTFHKEEISKSQQAVDTDSLSLDDVVDWSQYPSSTVIATGYTAGYESTGKYPGHPSYGITFSGVEVRRDLYSTIAADPTHYPIGSILYIPGYGYGVVADTGSAIKGNKIDLYYDTVEEVFQNWGKQEVEVFLVKQGNGNLTEEELNQLNENEAVQVFRRQLDF